MKRFTITLFIVLLVLLNSCAFKRDNPLDPVNSGTSAPGKVTNLHATSFSNRILLDWDSVTGANGYYVYRSLVYNGAYERIGEVNYTQATEYEDMTQSLLAETWYYYRVSAFTVVLEDLPPIEGQMSDYTEGYSQ